MSTSTIELLAYVGVITLLLIVSLVFIYIGGSIIDFAGKVRNYRKAKELQSKLDDLCNTCHELMTERDALRAENNMLREASPYRGPTMVSKNQMKA